MHVAVKAQVMLYLRALAPNTRGGVRAWHAGRQLVRVSERAATLADVTGVRAAAVDLRGSYSVGFYVPENSDNRRREFDVRVNRPGVRALHRKGYMALAPVKQPVN